ncbi:Gfo/Idh/MocA family protein [Microbacterium sp. 22303]|uniref:Gfo/Idh/MocA family protein n=1 Tax=Microbacterium sp. 22303 TaxID=3453905 RepID=UPI003F838636
MSGQRLRIGLVGAGNIASIAQLPSLVARDDVALSALVTRRDDPEPLMRRWGFSRAYSTVDAMLGAEELDAIFVLTPRSEHVEATKSALEAGVDVFCEKPLATRLDDAEMLARSATDNGRVLMVGFNRRFAPVYRTGREAFSASGATFCVAQKNRAGSEYRATFENAIHMIDLLRWYCGGEPVEVTAHAAGSDQWQEDGVAALVQFDNGHTGVLMAARNAGNWGEKIDAYGDGVSAEILAPDTARITRDGLTTIREMTPEAYGWATATHTLGFAGAVDHFLERVRDRREPLTSGREATKTQALLERILSAAGLPTEEQPGREWSSHAKK